MSTWVTPAGSIGTYTTQKTFAFQFEANASLGGRIVFELVGSWPPGSYRLQTTEPSPGVYRGTLTATSAYVRVPTTYNFVISATEIVATSNTTIVNNTNNRNFSVTIGTMVWQTDANLGEFTETLPISLQVVASPSVPGNKITYSLINGQFPASTSTATAITLTNSLVSGVWTGIISGTPGQVKEITTSNFTIRATETHPTTNQLVSFVDRTFSISVSGTTAPSFVSAAGSVLFITQDSTWVNYQVQVESPDPQTVPVVSLVSGNLPPGLTISQTGLITGYASPPFTSSGSPTTTNYNFTLSVKSASGESLASFIITVANQQLTPGFAGRQPAILNYQPLTNPPASLAPYSAYYLESGNLGEVTSDNYYIFKFIGYDFDGDDIAYEVIPGDVFSDLGLTLDTSSGWITGEIIQSLVPSVDTYNFVVSAYKVSNPSIRSNNYKFSITIINNIDTRIEWLVESDLGTINNGSISLKYVQARSLAGKNLSYRLVGNDFVTDLRTVVATNSQLLSFGVDGGYVNSSDNGNTWTLQSNSFLAEQQFTLLGSVQDPFTNITIVVGRTPVSQGMFALSTDGINWLFNFAPLPIPQTLTSVAFNNDSLNPIYVSVGTNGYSMVSNDGSNWTYVATGALDDLNQVYWDGSKFIAVGNRGTVLYSSNGLSWTDVVNSVTNDFQSIVYTGTTWVIVGDLGIIVRATDITNSATWEADSIFTNYDYNKIAYNSVAGELVIVGTAGLVQTSINDGVNWTVQNVGTTNTFYDIIFDSVVTNKFWAVGEAGTIYYDESMQVWTSPTISKLPPDLVLQSDGDIRGRLAFETQSTVTPQGTQTPYSFTVQAFSTDPGFEEIISTKQFTLTTVQQYALPYDDLYIKALVDLRDREYIADILENESLIPTADLYRKVDPYFGKARNVKYQHMFGVPSQASASFYSNYIQAVQKNHYWRNIVLGEIKTAVARDANNNIIYEVVYSEVQDNLLNAQGISISKEITWPRKIPLNKGPYYTSVTNLFDSMTYYDPVPAVKTVVSNSGTTIRVNNLEGVSVGMNMTGDNVVLKTDGTPPVITNTYSMDVSSVTQYFIVVDLAQSLSANDQIVISDGAYTSLTPGSAQVLYPNSLTNMRQQIQDELGFINDSALLPLWMTSQQANGSTLGYTQAWVLCYTLPGRSAQIAANINQYMESRNRYLNDIDFQIDRFEVDRSMTYGFEGGTATSPIWFQLPSPGVIGDSKDSYIYFPQKTILPLENQE